MDQYPPMSTRRGRGSRSVRWTGAAAALCLMLAAPPAYADPTPEPNPAPASPAPASPAPASPAPAAPGSPAPASPAPASPAPGDATPAPAEPAPTDPNAAPHDPNAAPAAPVNEPGRVNVAAGSFSYVVPAGWVVGDASRLNYGQALLTKAVPEPEPGQPAAAPANDTSILLGRLDLKLFAGAEPDNAKAAVRLASDMGEFFMPFPGTRVNQSTAPLDAGGMKGSASYYEVKFTDSSKPDGQIWAGVVGDAGQNAPRGQRNERWFVVWLGTAKDPIDKGAAVALANSIRQYTPPPAPATDPNAAAPAADPAHPAVGVPVPVENPDPAMIPAG